MSEVVAQELAESLCRTMGAQVQMYSLNLCLGSRDICTLLCHMDGVAHRLRRHSRVAFWGPYSDGNLGLGPFGLDLARV